MKEVLLDTNFILTCLKEKIDFFEEIKIIGMRILISKQVINELKTITNSKKKLHFRTDAELALKILEKQKESFRRVDLSNYGKNTDKMLKNFVEKNPRMILATLDKELQKKVKNKKMVIRGKNNLEIL